MKFSISARLALLGAGLLLGLPQTASAGVISKKDPCREVYVPPVLCKPTNGIPMNGTTTNGSYLPKLPICLPKTPTKCPPVFMSVLDALTTKLRCAPVSKCPPVVVDMLRPTKPVDCYVPTPKQPICVTPKKPVEVCITPTLRDCKPTYGGGMNGTVCAPTKPNGPSKPGYGGGGNPTPEPASLALAAMGAAGAIARMRRRRAASEQAKG